ncbi:hypothetical protein DPMN_124778 [Dreissena polymorpha]|uniref:Uncharacterized protein n=1 Tax=Dreissena polymorpha TaxID=45954 RepID=A0A9D4GT85_DREPO|nr:hypothetical protein DPMN_124778 [Dreissena polymorpha]
MNIAWKLPAKQSERNPAEVARNINLLKKDIMTFATRRMMKEFIDMYSKANVQSVVLRNMYHFLTDFEYTPHTEDQSEVDDRFMKFLVEAEDCELIYDLRKDNGRPNDPKFEPFWEALQKLIDETSAVHESS